MTRKPLANPTAEPTPPAVDLELLERLTVALEAIAKSTLSVDPELRCYTPDQAAEILGTTENWVEEHMNDKSIPFTYVGRFRRMRAKHIRAVAEAREVDPAKQGRRPRSAAA